MWTDLSDPWRACVEEAWAAYCGGSVPVGAVVTDANGRILAQAHNTTFERDGRVSPEQISPLAHAEVNVLSALDHTGFDPHPCILYTSTEPCPLCLGALYMSGVRELRYAGRDPYAGSVNLLGTTPYLSRKPIRIVHPESAVLETVVTALATEFALRVGFRAEVPAWLEAWRAVLPVGVTLGHKVFASRWLVERCDRGAPAAEVVDGLAELAQAEMKERR